MVLLGWVGFRKVVVTVFKVRRLCSLLLIWLCRVLEAMYRGRVLKLCSYLVDAGCLEQSHLDPG